MERQTRYKKVLALSRDFGSVQAILPVVADLKNKLFCVRLLSPVTCHGMVEKGGIVPDLFNLEAFAISKLGYISEIFDNFKPDLLLTGSSPSICMNLSTPEQLAIREARRRGIPSVTVLDTWGRYEERFCRHDGLAKEFLPDIVCALDLRSQEDLVRLGVPKNRIVITHNPFLDSVVMKNRSEFLSIDSCDELNARVLFVSQPLSQLSKDDHNHLLHHKLLRALVLALPSHRRHDVLVWRHPAEPKDRWENIGLMGSRTVDVRLMEGRDGILSRVDFMVTVNSTTAYEALHLGTPCLSFNFWPSLLPSYVDELGLSIVPKDLGELSELLEFFNPTKMRLRLKRVELALRDKGIFYSDGKATQRVFDQILFLMR